MSQIKLGVSNICTAFKDTAIGSKVTDVNSFLEHLIPAIQNHDTSKDRASGQHFIVLHDARECVSAGDGLKSNNPDDYIVRVHREGPKMFLKRERAGKTNFLAVVVYTREAYIADPDMTPEELEELEILDPWATHFVVAVIASSGPSSPVTPGRFVHNLAGGNNEYLRPSEPKSPSEDKRSVDEPWMKEVSNCLMSTAWQDADYVWRYILALHDHIDWLENKAKEIKEYWNSYSVVAD
jgi:hypothetical protein